MPELVPQGSSPSRHQPYYDYRTKGGTLPYAEWAGQQGDPQPDLTGLAGAPSQTPYPMPPMDRRASAYGQGDNAPVYAQGRSATSGPDGTDNRYSGGAYDIEPGLTGELAYGSKTGKEFIRRHGEFFEPISDDYRDKYLGELPWTEEGRGKTVIDPNDPTTPTTPTTPTGDPNDPGYVDPNNPFDIITDPSDPDYVNPYDPYNPDDDDPPPSGPSEQWLAEEQLRIDRKKYIANQMGLDHWSELDGTDWNAIYAQWQIDQKIPDDVLSDPVPDVGPGTDTKGNEIDHALWPVYEKFVSEQGLNAQTMGFQEWLEWWTATQDFGGVSGNVPVSGAGTATGGQNSLDAQKEMYNTAKKEMGFEGSFEDWQAAGSPTYGSGKPHIVTKEVTKDSMQDYYYWSQQPENEGKTYPEYVAATTSDSGAPQEEMGKFYNDYVTNGGNLNYFDWIRDGFPNAQGGYGSYADALRGG